MDSAEISRVMQAKRLASDPAFHDLTFIIGTLPNPSPDLLGLYYPDIKTIALPRDADDSTLLHEVGHRYGHYYYGDLTEDFAKAFSKSRELAGRVLLSTRATAYFTCLDCDTRFYISGNEIQCPHCFARYRRVG